MKTSSLLPLAALAFVLSGCPSSSPVALPVSKPGGPVPTPTPVLGKMPEVMTRIQAGFEDILFGVQKTEVSPSGDVTTNVAGTYLRQRIGFKILIEKAVPSSVTKSKGHGLNSSPGKIHLLSTGPESDRMVGILARIGNLNVAGTQMRSDTAFACTVREGEPANILGEPVRYKLIYGAEAGAPRENYAQVNLNINLPKGEVKLAERDPAYRPALVRALVD